ncbi:MAG: hypothetical protein QOF91_3257 [Alphaproteobacteria bacterium]|jgi:hypothetical protein|nr:hypothetical protein [Alphaproteobacteria bacterium]
MPPVLLPPLLKWTLASVGGAAIVHWVVTEVRRINDELDRMRAAAAVDTMTRQALPTLRRDPGSGEWRL